MLEDPVQGQRIKVVIDGVTDSAGTAYDGLLGKHSHQYCSCSAALADSYSDYYHIVSSDGGFGYYFKQWIPCTVHANWLNIFLEIYVKFRAKEIYVACRIFTARVIFLLIFFFTLFSKRNTFFYNFNYHQYLYCNRINPCSSFQSNTVLGAWI